MDEPIQCYLKECKILAITGTYWCSPEHEALEKEERYGRTTQNKIPLTISEIQRKLKEMGRKVVI